MAFQAYINNDNVVTLAGLKDVCTGAFANSATVTVTVTDKDGNEVLFDNTSDSWPRPMPYVTGSNGSYCGTIPVEAQMIPENEYIAVVNAEQSGVRGRWNIFFTAKHRDVLR
jgi:hypothetical protein